MNKIINNIKFWLNNSRAYTIPITTLSWLVIFVYSLKHGGNFLYGIIAWIGISLVHLATNLSDDYFDYKKILNGKNYSGGARDSKCAYLKNGQATIEDLRNAIIIMLAIAVLMGVILFFTSGFWVAVIALCTLPIALFYSKLSSRGLGDIAIIVTYGPLMYEGVYYSMTGKFSLDVLLLSFACVMFVNTVLYTHMLMDYDEDFSAGKVTLCTRFKNKNYALNFLMFFYISSYILIGIFSKKTNIDGCFTYVTMPLVCNIYNSLKLYNQDKTAIPKQFGFWDTSAENASFFMRFLYSRNILIIFMAILCLTL